MNSGVVGVGKKERELIEDRRGMVRKKKWEQLEIEKNLNPSLFSWDYLNHSNQT